MITPPKDKIVVKIDRSQEEEIHLAGGISLYLSTRLNLQEHVTLKGICVGVPEYLKREDLTVIDPLVKVGDEVYFSYQAIFDQHLTQDVQYYMNELKIDGESYWLIDYLCVFFTKKDDCVTMIGSHVLVEPVYEDKIYAAYLLAESNVKRMDRGIIISIGVPNKNENKINVKQGDLVAFDSQYVERYNFWDKPYFIIKQDRILHKIA